MHQKPSKRIFLSVAGPDGVWGDRMDHWLRSADFEVDYYRRSFPAGANFIQQINSALASCDHMVALLSPAYCDQRSWVTEEWQAALTISKRRPGFLIPFLIEKCHLPPLLDSLNYINLTGLSEQDSAARVLDAFEYRDWNHVTSGNVHGPADNTWVAAVYRAEDSSCPLGTAVVIDEHHLLTSARLVIENETLLDPLPWVAFPMARLSSTRRLPVVGVRLADTEYDLAILALSEAVPEGVKAARLRRPKSEYVLGKGWWTFGFSEGGTSHTAKEVLTYGGPSEGHIDAPLAHGFLRLDVDARSEVRAGYSGASLWSPDYDAAVGIISHIDDRGTGWAVTLHQAVQCFSDEQLSSLMAWSAGRAGEAEISAWGWAPHQNAYRFQGRKVALDEIIEWLDHDRPDRRALIVTGSPGSGKSAVLGRVVLTADPTIRPELPLEKDAPWAREGSVSCAVNVKGKTSLEVATDIARAFSAELPGLALPLDSLAPAISKALAEQGRRRFNLVIDALDEASRPADTRSIILHIIRPLLRTCRGAQIIVGTRRKDNSGDLMSFFGTATSIIDLDLPKYFSAQDLEAYALATLQLSGADPRPDNPYALEELARPLAARIAELSRGNFLVAGLTANSHAEYDQEPADPGRLTLFDEDAEDALYQALERALERAPDAAGVPLTTALTIMTALAYAEAPGMSLELWSLAVEALAHDRFPVTVLAEFARGRGGNFVVESSSPDSEPVFRLFHQALNDALLRRRAQLITSATGDPVKEDQQALTRAFLRFGRQEGWAAAPPYLLRSLSHHAEPAGLLDELLTDDEYLLHADLRRLTPLALQARTADGQDRAQLLRLTPYAVAADPPSRRALFSITEALEKLGDSFTQGPGPAPYRARWSTATTHLERARQEGHTGGITCLSAFTSTGRTLLVSTGEDEMVRIWDPSSGDQQRVLEGHGGTVNGACAFTQHGQTLLASAGGDAVVAVWDPVTGKRLRALEGHGGAVNGVCAFTHDGRTLLASAGVDAVVMVWDPVTGEQPLILEGHDAVVNGVCAFAHDGRTLLASAGGDAVVAVWDPVTGERLQALEGHGGAVNGVCAFTHRGQTLLASAGSDAMVMVWDPATGQRRLTLEGHVGGVWSVCGITSGGRTLLASTADEETVRVWDVDTGQQHRALHGHIGGAWTVCAFGDADGHTTLASAGTDSAIRMWDPADGQQQRTIRGQPGSVWSVSQFTSDDGRELLAAAGTDSRLAVRDPATGQLRRIVEGGGSWSVHPFSSDGHTLLAAASHDGRVRVWDPATGQRQQVLDPETGELWSVCAFTLAGRTVLAAAGGDGVVRSWDQATGELDQAMPGHVGTVWSTCTFTSPDGQAMLASAGDDEVIRIWDPAAGDLRRTLEGHVGGVWSMCVFASGDGRTLLASAGADAKVRIWDPATGELRSTLRGHTDGIWSVCTFISGGQTLLVSCARSVVRVWNPTTSQTVQVVPVHLVPHAVRQVGSYLILGLSAGLLAVELASAEDGESQHP